MLKTNYVIAINSAFDVASSSTKEESDTLALEEGTSETLVL